MDGRKISKPIDGLMNARGSGSGLVMDTRSRTRHSK